MQKTTKMDKLGVFAVDMGPIQHPIHSVNDLWFTSSLEAIHTALINQLCCNAYQTCCVGIRANVYHVKWNHDVPDLVQIANLLPMTWLEPSDSKFPSIALPKETSQCVTELDDWTAVHLSLQPSPCSPVDFWRRVSIETYERFNEYYDAVSLFVGQYPKLMPNDVWQLVTDYLQPDFFLGSDVLVKSNLPMTLDLDHDLLKFILQRNSV